MSAVFELCVVVPVYNEQQNLGAFIRDWQRLLTSKNISFRMLIIDDGSTDDSGKILLESQDHFPQLQVVTQTNRGHGQAILKGYGLSSPDPWILQLDADHQWALDAFDQLWSNRNNYDLLMGVRQSISASRFRRLLTKLSKNLVSRWYGSGLPDVNCPYRLMRAGLLSEALSLIPKNSFAPNMLISAFSIARKKRIFTTPVMRRPGAIERSSGMSRYFIRGSVLAFAQLFSFRSTL